MRKTVRTAVAPLLSEPRISASIASQFTQGDVLTVLETQGDWHRVHGVDEYIGWTHTGYLTESTGDEASWRLSLGVSIMATNGTVRALPLGARIAPRDTVHSGAWCDATDRAIKFPHTATAVAQSAETLFANASYLWGGVTPWGCDCSGFVQRIFALHGVPLPRDAWQQADRGTSTGARVTDHHAAGDLLFFSDREDARVTHVGIALTTGRMMHSALARGGVTKESLDADDAYCARLRRQCVDVRRVL